MLIGCISGPDLLSAEEQIGKANLACAGAELRVDLLEEGIDLKRLLGQIQGISILTADNPDLLSLEPDYLLVSWDHPERFLSSKTKIIRAYHNYEETPENLEEILEGMPSADLYKIVTRARSTLDGIRMGIFAKERPEVIGFCMGEEGEFTRVLPPLLESPFNFAPMGDPVAPGQLSLHELEVVYNYSRLNPETRLYALIGDPVEQSPSHWTHNGFFHDHDIDALYVKLRIQPGELARFLKLAPQLGILGVSVTCPYKETILPYIDEWEGEAKEIGAVNTVTFASGKIYGANTDAKGALDAIEKKQLVSGCRVVILGAGGAARAISYEAKKRGAQVRILNRSVDRAEVLGDELGVPFGSLDDLEGYEILVNTTSSPFPVDLEKIQKNTLVMDVGFNRDNSPLIQKANELGCMIVLGEEMFRRQAAGQFARWLSSPVTL